MFSNEIILTPRSYGECQIDVERVKSEWHDNAWIYRVEEQGQNLSAPIFRLIEFDPKKNNSESLKVTISRKDALKLIQELGLVPMKEHPAATITYYRKMN